MCSMYWYMGSIQHNISLARLVDCSPANGALGVAKHGELQQVREPLPHLASTALVRFGTLCVSYSIV